MMRVFDLEKVRLDGRKLFGGKKNGQVRVRLDLKL